MSAETHGDAVLAAVAHVDVDQLPALRSASSAGSALADQAARIVVDDAISAETATALLGQVVAARRHAEAQRVALTKPLRGVVEKINAAAKRTLEPLAEIEKGLKGKLLAYQREMERRAGVERARLEAEAERRRAVEAERLRQVEAAARAEREAAARAAAQAEATARQAREEQARRAREASDALAVQIRAASDEQLEAAAAKGSPELAAMAAAELDSRRRLRRVEAERGAAVERELEARQAEEAARQAAPLPIAAPKVEAPARLAGGGASVSVRRRWTFEVTDFALVPDAYKELARGQVQAAVRGGERSIPGLRIFQAEDASVAL